MELKKISQPISTAFDLLLNAIKDAKSKDDAIAARKRLMDWINISVKPENVFLPLDLQSFILVIKAEGAFTKTIKKLKEKKE